MGMEEKIGVLTFVYNENYGSALQAFALQRILTPWSREVKHLCYTPDTKERLKNFITSRNSPALLLMGVNKRLVKKRHPGARDRSSAFRAFYSEDLRVTRILRNSAAVEAASKAFDVLICGSDQIWSPVWFNPVYFLPFASEGQRRIAYAPSLGVSVIRSRHKAKKITSLLANFQHLSVREPQGARLLGSLLHRNDIPVLLDPVCLLAREEWEAYAARPIAVTENDPPYIFCYFLGDHPRYWREARAFAGRTGMRLKVAAVTQKAYKQPYDILDGLSPAQWLGYLSRAAYVFTDSFHCTVFSIIMERNFHVFLRDNPRRASCKNTRIESVLNLFQLKFHNENVDWDEKRRTLVSLREKSLRWLREALR